ncbi:MAG: DUF1667 domain-containing protein [Lachnospiraceae bacterium]|nr:DUF1667 domain-containing protein [Lachnospiraceae bacterium]
MEKRELICIGCPMGCMLEVTLDNGDVVSVEGNTCKMGDTYARKEVTNPTRIVTSTVVVDGGTSTRLPVKTACDVPKSAIFDVMEQINRTHVNSPVKIGEVVIANTAGTGVDVIATRSVS